MYFSELISYSSRFQHGLWKEAKASIFSSTISKFLLGLKSTFELPLWVLLESLQNKLEEILQNNKVKLNTLWIGDKFLRNKLEVHKTRRNTNNMVDPYTSEKSNDKDDIKNWFSKPKWLLRGERTKRTCKDLSNSLSQCCKYLRSYLMWKRLERTHCNYYILKTTCVANFSCNKRRIKSSLKIFLASCMLYKCQACSQGKLHINFTKLRVFMWK